MAKQTFTTGQVLTAAQMTSLQQTAMGGGSTTAKTTSYVLTAADAGTVVQMNAAGATTITVNTALFAAGDTVQIQNIGAGVCTVTAGTATVNTAGSLALSQWEGGQLYFTATGAAVFFDIVQGSAGGMTLLSTTTLSGTSTTISSIDQTYINLMVLFQGVGNSTGAGYFRVAFNGNTANAQCGYKNSSGTAWVNGSGYFFPMGQDTMSANYGASSGMVIEDYTSTALKPIFSAGNGFATTSQGPTFASGSYSNSEAISSLVLTTSNGGTLIGTVKIYGVK